MNNHVCLKNMSFELMPPSLGLGNAKNNQVGYQLEGRIIANPILGAKVRLDLLALGSKLKPWAVILDALDIAA